MKVIIVTKKKKKYYYLKHSIRKNDKIITKEIYLGTKIPKNIDNIKQQFYRNINKELFKKLEKISENFKKEWDKLPNSIKEKELEEIAIAFTYNTNAIEGSTITLHETRDIIKDKYAPAKEIKDIEETIKHSKVFLNSLKKKEIITKKLLLKWHKEIFENTKKDIAGKFRDYLVRVGSYIAPLPEDMHKMLNILIKFCKESKLHPVEFAGRVHYIFEKAHPFGDGNGRIGRILMNYILWHNKYPIIIIEYKNRKSYYRALEKNEQDFTNYFIKRYLIVHKKRYE